MMLHVMGEYAEMALEQCGWGYDENDDDFDCNPAYWHERKPLKCSSCGKPNLAWRRVANRWVMMERTGGVHTCQGYEPCLEVLKELAKEVTSDSHLEELWHLRDKAKRRGGIMEVIRIASDDQLLDLYACFIRDNQSEYDNPEIGLPINYKHEIRVLKEEILRRINKK